MYTDTYTRAALDNMDNARIRELQQSLNEHNQQINTLRSELMNALSQERNRPITDTSIDIATRDRQITNRRVELEATQITSEAALSGHWTELDRPGSQLTVDEQCLAWDLATVRPSGLGWILIDQRFVKPDLTTSNFLALDTPLPKQIWLDSCRSRCDEEAFVKLEIFLHAVKLGQADQNSALAFHVLHAAYNRAHESLEYEDDERTSTAFCALRMPEAYLRYAEFVDARMTREVYDTAAGALASRGEDPLVQSLLQWLRSAIDDRNYADTLFNVLDSMETRRLETTCKFALADGLLGNPLIATPTGVLNLDYWTGVITYHVLCSMLKWKYYGVQTWRCWKDCPGFSGRAKPNEPANFTSLLCRGSELYTRRYSRQTMKWSRDNPCSFHVILPCP